MHHTILVRVCVGYSVWRERGRATCAPQVTSVADAGRALQCVLPVSLQQRHAVVAPVERPPRLPRVALGVVLGPLVNMVNGEAPLRNERIESPGLSVLYEQILAVREAVGDLEHVGVVYHRAGRVDTRSHDGDGRDPVQLDAGPRAEHGWVHLRRVKAPADGHEAEGAQPCVRRQRLVAVHVGEPVHVGYGVRKHGRACRHVA